MAYAIPAFSNISSVYKDVKGAPGSKPRIEIGNAAWCWSSCDVPYLVWYQHTGSRLQHVRFFWFLEWDVVWTGDIAAILTPFSALHEVFDPTVDLRVRVKVNDSDSNSALFLLPVDDSTRLFDHDLLCPNPSWGNLKWAHRGKRDHELISSPFVHRCVTNIFRMTHRLLAAVLEFSNQQRAAMFCEMRSPTICAMNSWCRMRSFFDGRLSHLFHTAGRYNASHSLTKSESDNARNQWVASWAAWTQVQDTTIGSMETPMFYHAYKWGEPSRNDSGMPPAAASLAEKLKAAHSHEHHGLGHAARSNYELGDKRLRGES